MLSYYIRNANIYESSLNILIPSHFADELTRELLPPHQLSTYDRENDAAMAGLVARADILISGSYQSAWKDPSGKRPKLIHSVGAGVDGIDFNALPPGCSVCNVYGHARGVAEHAFLLLMALHKNLPKLDASLREGNWIREQPYLPEMRDRNLLVLGLGQIGEQLVRWGKFLDMNITGLTRSPSSERASKLGLDNFGSLQYLEKHLPNADFLVTALPDTPETKSLIDMKAFQAMKTTAFIVNVGRGPVIEEQALYEALRTRMIAGAGIDVWYQYPTAENPTRHPSRYPLYELDNIIMTPHKPTIETMAYRWREIAENVRRFAKAESLKNLVYHREASGEL